MFAEIEDCSLSLTTKDTFLQLMKRDLRSKTDIFYFAAARPNCRRCLTHTHTHLVIKVTYTFCVVNKEKSHFLACASLMHNYFTCLSAWA